MSSAAPPPRDGEEEEGIMVAIRMRPLNHKESSSSTTKTKGVWRVLSKYDSVTQTTPDGKPLAERIAGRSYFSFDKTFNEKSTTRQVYDEVARGIVGSVTNGLNGTIFAYGQTSSGKTYTMQGSGSIESLSNLNQNGGIVHMAASDIFSHIESNTDRVFLVRVSFIEIYNEEVRDLLVSGGDDNTLNVREDRRRGVFVNSNETIVTGLDSLLSVLFAGEKNRSVASTGMNERSSRSHTIFRITVESRLKNAKMEKPTDGGSDDEMEVEDESEMSGGNGAVRVSTLNLVDLAGSESVRHTGATGERQKEGGNINKSLLTLSRVIGSLGQPNATHVNFRDSKLTLILKPSLSGNARMAVICCATPSELYLEETRSTLQFASRAKLVKTRAQVNEVIDDRSLIKKLQRELKEARDGNGHVEQMKALEEKAVNEAEAKRKAEQDLKRMKDLILKGGMMPMNISCNSAGTSSLLNSLFVYNDDSQTISTGSSSFPLSNDSKRGEKRRYSDGVIKCPSPTHYVTNKHDRAIFNSPKSTSESIPKFQAKTEIKPKKPKSTTQISITALTEENDIDLLRKALAAKSSQAHDLKSRLSHALDQTTSHEQRLQNERREKEMLRMAKLDLEYQVTSLASDKEFVMTERDIDNAEKNDEIGSYLGKIENMLQEAKGQKQNITDLDALVKSLQNQIESMKKKHAAEIATMTKERTDELEAVQSEMTELRNQTETLQTECSSTTESLKAEHICEVKMLHEEHESVIAEMKLEVDVLRGQIEELQRNYVTEVETLTKQQSSELEEVQSKLEASMNTQIEELKIFHSSELEAMTEKHNQLIADAQSEKEKLKSELLTKEEANQSHNALLESANSTISGLQLSLQESRTLLEQTQSQKAFVDTQLASLTEDKENLETKCTKQFNTIEELRLLRDELIRDKESGNSNVETLNSHIIELTNQNALLEKELDEKKDSLQHVTGKLESALEANATLEEVVDELKRSATKDKDKFQQYESRLISLQADLESLVKEKTDLVEENASLHAAKNNSEELLEKLNKEITENDAKNKQKFAELSTSLQKSSQNLSEATLNIESLEANLKEKEGSIDEMNEKFHVANSQLQAVTSKKDALEVHNKSLIEELSAVTTAESNSKAEALKLTDENAILIATKERLESDLADAINQKDSMDANAKELSGQVSELEQLLDTVTRERDNITGAYEALQSDDDSAAKALTESLSKINDLEGRIAEMQKEGEIIQNEKFTLEESVNELKQTLEKLVSEGELSSAKISELETEKEANDAKITALTSVTETLEKAKENLASTIETKDKQIADILSQLDASDATNRKLQEHVHDLSRSIEQSRTEITRLESLSQHSCDADNDKFTELEKNIHEFKNEVSEKSNLIATLESKISEVTLELEAMKKENNTISAQMETSTLAIASMESDIVELTQQRDTAQSRTKELLEGDGQAMTMIQSLQSEKAALVAKVEEVIARLDGEKEDTQSNICNLNSTIAELQQNNEKLNTDLSTAKAEISELLSIAEKSEAEYKSLLSEREDCLKELEDVINQNEELANKLNDAETRHKEEIAKLQQTPSTESGGDPKEIATLMIEIDDLKVLLATSNISVEEARTAALEADQELEEKELQLEKVSRDLAVAQEMITSLKSTAGNGQTYSESEEELLKEMEVLMNEKVEAESRLEVELSKRKDIEYEIQRAADEEKQLVMNEAEEKMLLLRDEISQLRSDLSRVEQELYTTKDETEDLRDQHQRAESKVRDTEKKVASISNELVEERRAKAEIQQQLDQLHEESKNFKSQVFAAKAALEAEAQSNLQTMETKLTEALSNLSASDREIKHLNEIIEDLSNDIEDYQRQLKSMNTMESAESDLETSRLREELARTKVELSTLNEDYLSAKSEAAASKEKIAQVKAREHEKCLALAQKAKESIEHLQERIKKAEAKAEQDGCSEAAKEQLDELNRTIKDRDARIKKLEKTKMTKEQVEKIRKMQEERIKYMDEAKDYKRRVEELEKEIADSKPRRKGLRERTSEEDSDDVDQLKDELKQCNLKLRKYVQHSDHLEKERNNVMTVISSCNTEDIVGNSLEDTVASLCERLSSLEEECDALANSENKAAEYLADLDSLRQKYQNIEKQLQFYKDTNDELSSSHADCKDSLKKAHEKIATLTKEHKSLQESHTNTKGSISDLQSEQRRQMQWLEKENLQLGDELKRTKKELLQTKTQLGSMQKSSFGSDEATEDLVGISTFFEHSATKRQPLGSISKPVNQEKKPQYLPSSSAKTSSSKKRPVQESRDKENNLNESVRSPIPSSAKKQRKINPFSSVKKASKKIVQSFSDDSSPKHLALGDETEHTTELTSDCKQS